MSKVGMQKQIEKSLKQAKRKYASLGATPQCTITWNNINFASTSYTVWALLWVC